MLKIPQLVRVQGVFFNKFYPFCVEFYSLVTKNYFWGGLEKGKTLLPSAGINTFIPVAISPQATGAFSLRFLWVNGLHQYLKSQFTVFFDSLGQTRLISCELSCPAFLLQLFSSGHKPPKT
jgi:hypothetical protein